MPSWAFEYARQQQQPCPAFPNGFDCYRPLVGVKLISEMDLWLDCTAVLDSGSDYCVFPLKFAKQVGIIHTVLPKHPVRGSGGSRQMYFTTVTIGILLPAGEILTFETKAGFTSGLDEIGMAVLGHLGFFDRFAVAFDCAQRVFSITTNES